ncbi:uncharacterized protein LOC123319379 [Coccinella septempunctata]|uniref:uncharacterized protein LOC123319379 n=1 Tax=Coccinella septempunctata TaxID=41139 RepID=UPI001D07F7A1|nr:uncharacterized protein LOC123319379 [Coccinella septempunctata]
MSEDDKILKCGQKFDKLKLWLRIFQFILNVSLLSFVEDHSDYVYLLSFAAYSLSVFASIGNSVIVSGFLVLRFAGKVDVYVEEIWLFCGAVFHLIFGGIILSVNVLHELGERNRISGYLSVLVGIVMLVEPVAIIFKRNFWKLR